MFDNEIFSLETLKQAYENVISELDLLSQYLNNYVKYTKDMNIINNNKSSLISFNSQINNVFQSLKYIQNNTKLNTDYGQTDKPFKSIGSGYESVIINYTQEKTLNKNINTLRLLPICKISSFHVTDEFINGKNYNIFYINKLNRINPRDFIELRVPMINENELISLFILESKDAIEEIEKIITLLNLNIKRLELGVKHIKNLSKINYPN
tara:strand:+ start:114 stop:743 length:630 start_codon:yes stop_codon:yes gene_type:complete